MLSYIFFENEGKKEEGKKERKKEGKKERKKERKKLTNLSKAKLKLMMTFAIFAIESATLSCVLA